MNPSGVLEIADRGRVRTLTLNRPEALNAFNEALYDACADALLEAAEDPAVAVVVITGAGRAFSAGTDLLEMAQMNTDPDFQRGRHGFGGPAAVHRATGTGCRGGGNRRPLPGGRDLER